MEKAQSKIETRNFEIRKQLLKFDDVMNDQRTVIFEQRKEIMRSGDVQDTVTDMRREAVSQIVERSVPAGTFSDQWNAAQLQEDSQRVLGIEVPAEEWFAEDGVAETEIEERLTDMSDRYMAEKAVRIGPDTMRMAEKSLLLQVLDQQWKQHLLSLEQLRQGISLRAYAQKDPLNEYKREAFTMFEGLLTSLRETVTMVLSHVEVRQPEPEAGAAEQASEAPRQLAAGDVSEGIFRRAEGRRAGFHIDIAGKGAIDARGALAHLLQQGDSGKRFGILLHHRSGDGHRCHRPSERKWRDHHSLAAPCGTYCTVQHRPVMLQRRG